MLIGLMFMLIMVGNWDWEEHTNVLSFDEEEVIWADKTVEYCLKCLRRI